MTQKQQEGALAEMRAQILGAAEIDSIHVWSMVFLYGGAVSQPGGTGMRWRTDKEQMALYQERDLVKDGIVDYDSFFKKMGFWSRATGELMNLLHHMGFLSVGIQLPCQASEGIRKEYTVLGIVDFMKNAEAIRSLFCRRRPGTDYTRF